MGRDLFIHLSVNALRLNQEAWGDTQFAHGLAAAIRAIPGCDAGVVFRGEAPPVTAAPAVILRIFGPHLEEAVPGLPNLLWMISPPNMAPLPMLARYQMLFCGSRVLAHMLAQQGLPARYLPQATDTAHFNPSRRLPGTTDLPLVFVGGHAPRAERQLVLAAVAAGFEPQIWGPGWKGVIPDHLWCGERLDYDELAQVYARARVILNSHMSKMAMLGFMSNRSYDALASGALVLSDLVVGFSAPDLPEIRQVRDAAVVTADLGALLTAPPLSLAARQALHDRVAARHCFAARAQIIVAAARWALQAGVVPGPAFHPGAALPAHAPPPSLSDPAASGPDSQQALAAAAAEILAILRYLEQPEAPALAAPPAAPTQGVIHHLMTDLRAAQRLATLAPGLRPAAQLEALAERARRVHEALLPNPMLLALPHTPRDADHYLSRVLQGQPLWHHSPEGFNRDPGKISLPLWPRRQPARSARPVGVFLHLFHDDLAPVFAERLRAIESAFQLYISTETEARAARIRAHLPQAEIRVLENRGRDIWPKLYGFGDVYHRHDIVLHLHGKKSLHSNRLDVWLDHILTCLLGSPDEVSRILSFFEAIPRLGMVVPVTFRQVLGAAHWAANRDIACELAGRMGLAAPLPDDADLRFPVGSMFWGRVSAIQPLLDLGLAAGHFPPEAGQIDGTLAHALERMLGVVCRAEGYHILPVSGIGQRLHMKHQKPFQSNGALRAALEAGAFDG